MACRRRGRRREGCRHARNGVASGGEGRPTAAGKAFEKQSLVVLLGAAGRRNRGRNGEEVRHVCMHVEWKMKKKGVWGIKRVQNIKWYDERERHNVQYCRQYSKRMCLEFSLQERNGGKSGRKKKVEHSGHSRLRVGRQVRKRKFESVNCHVAT